MSDIQQDEHIRKIETPPEIAEGVDGRSAFILMQTWAKGKHFKALTDLKESLNRLGLLIQRIQSFELIDVTDENERQRAKKQVERWYKDAETERERVETLTERVYQVYVYLIVDWNWRDCETGEPLPKPDNRQVFEEELTPQQVGWIKEQIETLRTYRATEGNAKSTTLS